MVVCRGRRQGEESTYCTRVAGVVSTRRTSSRLLNRLFFFAKTLENWIPS